MLINGKMTKKMCSSCVCGLGGGGGGGVGGGACVRVCTKTVGGIHKYR